MAANQFGTKYDRHYCTIVTPYKDNFEVDEQALRKFLRYFLQPKFLDIKGGIIVNAQAGEIDNLSRAEKKKNVEIAMEEVGGKMPVFGGVGGANTEDAMAGAKDVKEVGADGYMLFSPLGPGSWADPEQYPEVWLDYAKAVYQAVDDLPIIGHPTGRGSPIFGMGLPLKQTVMTCQQIPNIIGWKMVYPMESHPMITNALRSLDHHVGVFEAAGFNFHFTLANDYMDGSVSGSFNYSLELSVDHINAWKRRDITEAVRIWHSGLEHLHEFLYVPIFRLHLRYKIAAWLRGFIPHPFMRPPLPRPHQGEVAILKERLIKCGYEVIPEKDINRVTAQLLP
jgi:dihydrodipicolinate synthase/N-acetylneuraminate lyase